MPLLKNAVLAIEIAIEDSKSGEKKRLLSCVRNLHAGILLLFKERLRRLSPAESNEVLLKEKISPFIAPGEQIAFKGVGKKTVDVQTIMERFSSLGICVDWTRFNRVNKLRKDIEHYYTTVSQKAIEGAVSDTFLLIRNFIKLELKEVPLILLGKVSWDAMLKMSDVFESERKECQEKIGRIGWESSVLASGVYSLECKMCGSPLLLPADETTRPGLQCVSCGSVRNFDAYVEEAVEDRCFGDNYLAFTNGGEAKSRICPFCKRKTYMTDEEKCLSCGRTCQDSCRCCGERVPTSKLSSLGNCSKCEDQVIDDTDTPF